MQAPRLKEWRLARGLSQADLSKMTGTTEHTISRIENGAPLRPSTARKFARALNIDVMDLLESPPVPLAL